MEPIRRPVTHVFTDIEGSTRLWDTQPGPMGSALALHDALARRIIGIHGGRFVKTTGDGWHAVFDDPVDALGAACAFEIELPSTVQATGVPLRVRCGVHTGFGEARDGDFYGSEINRAARVMNAAHGGQVLVTQAVSDLIGDRLPAGLALRELGRIRLRDLASAERVFQLVHPSLPRAFPPPRGLDATPNNLPLLASSFVGRTGALAELAEALASHRLVTITGPGGIGKTRVALHLAADVLDHFDDGVWVVELARIDAAAQVPAAIAGVLSIREEPDQPVATSVTAFLTGRRALVVLDNCEHLLDACAAIADAVLRSSPGSRIVATSREELGVDGEHVYALPALALPAPDADDHARAAAHSPAVALFVERAREQASEFALTDRNAVTIARICRRLDGMPLAIELAAARVRSLGLDDIERLLDDRFRLLTGGRRLVLPRHRTLEALVAWSYDLLSEHECALFDRLGVFVGGFDLDAAEAVAARPPIRREEVVNLLGSLVAKSLVVAGADENGVHVRYRMLETLRDFALRQLEVRGETASTREQHAAHFTLLAKAQPNEADAEARSRYFLRMEDEHDNLRAALAWRTGAPGTGEVAAELAVAMTDFWRLRGYECEGARALAAVLALPVGARASELRARLATEACVIATHQARFDDARRLGEIGVADFRIHGRPGNVAGALQRLAEIAGREASFETSLRLSEEALAIYRAEGDSLGVAKMLVNLGVTSSCACEFDRARSYAEAGLAAAHRLADIEMEAYAELTLASIEIETDRLAAARAHYERLLPLARQTGDRLVEVLGRAGLSQVELAAGNLDLARTIALEALDYFEASSMRREIAFVLDDFAHALALRGDPITAARLFAAADRQRSTLGAPLTKSERMRTDARILAARTSAEQDAFAAAWADGAALSLEEAARLARATPLPPAIARTAPAMAPR